MDACIDIIDPRFAALILDNATLEVLASGFRWTEGPVWIGDADCLLFQDLPNDRTMRWIEGQGVSVFRTPSRFANGQTRDREGRLVVCSHLDRCLVRLEHDGAITRLVDRHAGLRLNAPNDVVVKSDGTIWFTDPLYGISTDYEGERQRSEQPPAVYRFDPRDGTVRVVASDFEGPNGLAFSADESRLFVSETGDQSRPEPKQVIRVFDLAPDGNSLASGRDFWKVDPGYCDGLRIDVTEHVWASAADGVHCIAPDGTLIGRIRVPHRVSNLCFGGPRKNRLFLCGSDTLYSIFVNTRGAQWP